MRLEPARSLTVAEALADLGPLTVGEALAELEQEDQSIGR